MLGSSTLANACINNVKTPGTIDSLPIIDSVPNDDTKALSVQYAAQGIRVEEVTGTLWCMLCTAHMIKDRNVPLTSCLVTVGSCESDIRKHCATRNHLLRYEEKNGVHYGCPVEIHGQKMILENHCVYPRSAFGPGRMLMDMSLAHKCLLAQDVCGGVKLTPHHQYVVTEFIIPYYESHEVENDSPVAKKKRCENGSVLRYFNSSGQRNYMHSGRTFRTDDMLRRSNVTFSMRDSEWNSSDYLHTD